jgi:hypothetical protein
VSRGRRDCQINRRVRCRAQHQVMLLDDFLGAKERGKQQPAKQPYAAPEQTFASLLSVVQRHWSPVQYPWSCCKPIKHDVAPHRSTPPVPRICSDGTLQVPFFTAQTLQIWRVLSALLNVLSHLERQYSGIGHECTHVGFLTGSNISFMYSQAYSHEVLY